MDENWHIFQSRVPHHQQKVFQVRNSKYVTGRQDSDLAINQWIDRTTGGQLKHAIDSTSGVDFLVIDTTWFKGLWLNPFNPAETHPEDFTLLSGTRKLVPMMPRNSRFRYFGGAKFQAVALDYSQATMYVFLPNEDSSLVEFEQLLTSENWTSWMQAFGSKDGFLELPKFTAEYKGNLIPTLETLGMTYPFESLRSFAPAVSNLEGAKLTKMFTEALLKVDEKGTEVVTTGTYGGVVGGIGVGPPPTPFRMIVNRPFFFAICDRNTQAILYLGVIVEP
jgi:serpin B